MTETLESLRAERDAWKRTCGEQETAMRNDKVERDKWRRLACDMTGDECVPKCNDGSGYHADDCPVVNTQMRFQELLKERDELRREQALCHLDITSALDARDTLQDENDKLLRQRESLYALLHRVTIQGEDWGDDVCAALAEIEKETP